MPLASLAATALTVVSANVGNINGACLPAKYKLCQPAVEARAATALRALRPDVIGLIELLPDGGQAERLLGPGYEVTCDQRYGWDCLAVRTASGVRLTKRIRTRGRIGDCDDGFTLNRAALRYPKRTVQVAFAHPDSSSTKATCRTKQLKDLFTTVSRKGPVLALGDWNLDPYREKDASVTAFKTARTYLGLHLVTGPAFSLLPGTSMGDGTGEVLDDGTTPFPFPFSGRTLDHVLTRGLKADRRCRVRRVDGGGGMDHRAQVCRLRLKR